MAQNDYQTFGDSGVDGVNKLSLANYTADNDRVYGNGYTTKVIRSQLHNKALQQTSKISAAVAQFLVNNGQDALDTDSFSTLATKLGTVYNLKANLASPTFTGVPAAPTAAAGTNTTQVATTAHVYASVNSFGGAISAAVTLTSAQSGGRFTVAAATVAYNITLPTASAGLNFEFEGVNGAYAVGLTYAGTLYLPDGTTVAAGTFSQINLAGGGNTIRVWSDGGGWFMTTLGQEIIKPALANNQSVTLGQLNLKAPLASPTFTGTVSTSQNIIALPTDYDSNQFFLMRTSTPTSGVSFSTADGRIMAIGEGPNGTFIRTGGNRLDLSATSGVLVPNAVADNQAVNLGQLDQVLHVREEQPTATDGGGSTAGNQVRVLNTVVRNTIVGASLASNQITLPAGKYSIFATAPAYRSDHHRVRLVNVTDSTVIFLGTSQNSANADQTETWSHVTGIFTLTATKNINMTHYIQTAVATNGLGTNTNDTFVSVYTSVYITKIG